MDHAGSPTSYTDLRADWPTFHYRAFTWEETREGLHVTYHFEVPGLTEFHPQLVFPPHPDRNGFLDAPDTPLGRRILFSLGMTELVSYWKATCSPTVIVHAGWLDETEIRFWKRLYHRGLSEFFYRNGIDTTEDAFMDLQTAEDQPDDLLEDALAARKDPFRLPGGNLIPVGGGKDSIVTLDLLSDRKKDNVPYLINPTPAGRDSIRIAGYGTGETQTVIRRLDPNLLDLNRRGLLNGHTPFSAIVAFTGYLAAYLNGLDHIVLSNEASANEGNIAGTDVNHQYSKSFTFEADFRAYCVHSLSGRIHYFSLLRPFNELQIACRFAALPDYLDAFRSCNVGSRENRWCGQCAKCLFVRLILAPFLEPERLDKILGRDLLNDPERIPDFKGLTGLAPVKPFECVGVDYEVRCAVEWAIRQYTESERALPLLFRLYISEAPDLYTPTDCADLMQSFNEEHGIPESFWTPVQAMRAYVSGDH